MNSTFSSGNRLLGALSVDDAALIAPYLEPIELGLRFPLARPQMPLEHVYFMDSGVASTVAYAGRVGRAEVGIFGREGMSGIELVMGDRRSPPLERFMQVPGAGQRIAAESLCEAMEQSPTLRLFLLRYVQSSQMQVAHTALSNAHARLEERLCRWLLMCDDRVDGNIVQLTHEFLAVMLGVRRAGVTLAIHMLEGRGLVRATRGSIEIHDRDGLELGADGSYGVPEAEYQRLLGFSMRE